MAEPLWRLDQTADAQRLHFCCDAYCYEDSGTAAKYAGRGLAPVAAGALVIEDGIEAAVERGTREMVLLFLKRAVGKVNMSDAQVFESALRAAVGEGDR